MRKLLLFIPFLLSCFFCAAQNWQCLQAGVKHYFINTNNYLRGIRIDSVITFGDTTVYYPFHTQRGLVGISIASLDTNGGSWLGSKAIRYLDGTFTFYNKWHDSEIIKSLANVGDTWIFYADTSSKYYTATMIGTDTMTILGAMDSLKSIMINAYDSGRIDTTDVINGFIIQISKNHGFFQIFDLCTFPLHTYLVVDTLTGGITTINTDYFYYICNNQTFKLVDFKDPSQLDIYNTNPGDVFEYQFTDESYYPWHYGYILDTILSKTVISSTQTNYLISGWTSTYIPYPPSTIISHSVDTMRVFSTPLIDTNLMPEEYRDQNLYYYYPYENSFCYPSNHYSIVNGILFNVFEPCGVGDDYKERFGHIANSTCDEPGLSSDSYNLVYANIDSVPCGTFTPLPLGVQTMKNEALFKLSPNPASNDLIITTTFTTSYTITLINMLGQQVYKTTAATAQQTIDVSRIPAGVYEVLLQDSEGEQYYEKVVIVH